MVGKAKVFFTNFRVTGSYNMLDKLERLVREAGFSSLDLDKKFVAVKVHFGEPGNLAYIRPNYVARLVKLIKARGGKAFLTDSNTLYKGRRANAVDHLESALENGWYPPAVGCPVIIADGLRGIDYREIPLGMKNCATAKIGAAVADADVIISVNHFKGHEMTGFGGALKNLGMGSGSIGGKLEMHNQSKPHIVPENCTACRACVKNCSREAVTIGADRKAHIDFAKCIGCGQCVAVCIYGAATVDFNEASVTAAEKIAEYASAVVSGKPCLHVNFVTSVSPDCDCWAQNDAPIVGDIGILASTDPVALDRACADLVNAALPSRGSRVEALSPGDDKFSAMHPGSNWKHGLAYAESIGVGTQDYELVSVEYPAAKTPVH